MRKAAAVALLFALTHCASPVAAQDASADSTTTGCGVPSTGACQGQTYLYCESDGVVSVDCSMTGGRCSQINSTGIYSCLQPIGANCRTVVPHGNHTHNLFAFCEGASSGCLQDRTSGRCVADLGACVDADIDTCRGERIISNCRAGQPIAIDCAALGARCDAASRVCAGVVLGAPCDRVRRQCAAGTRCQMARGETLGVCVAIESDAGADASSDASSSDGAVHDATVADSSSRD
jgi:hypothetical protein